jgi:YbgC/YbaW family acyl-CoA thioester hydrolase
MAFVQERVIEWGDCDAAGIVYYPNYFRWIDGCFHAMCRASGFDQMTMMRDHGLVGTPLMESGLKFRSPGRYHDPLRVQAVISRLGAKGLTVDYTLTIDGRLVAEGHEVRAVAAEVEGKLRSVPIPPAIRAALEPWCG